MPIPYETAGYYETSVEKVDQISILCFLIYFCVHIFSVFLADRHGLGINITLSMVFLVISATLREASVTIHDKQVAFDFAFASSAVSMLAGGMVTILPAKCASIWFPENLRVLANSLCSLASQLGLMLCYTFAPYLVSENHEQYEMQNYAYFAISIGLLAIFTSLVFLSLTNFTGLPQEAPPSASSKEILATFKENQSVPVFRAFVGYYFHGIKAFGDVRGFTMVTLVVALGLSIGTNLIGATPQIMCPYGYSKEISSIAVLVGLTIGGYLGVFCVSFAIGKKWLNGEVAIKILAGVGTEWLEHLNNNFSLALFFDEKSVISKPFSICCAWFVMLTMPTYNHEKLVIFAYFLFGVFLLPAIPLAHELAVECTYPMGAGLSSGLMNIVADLFGFVVSLITYGLARDFTDQSIIDDNACNLDGDDLPKDFSISMWVLGGIFTVFGVIFVVGFRCPFLRQNKDENIGAVGGERTGEIERNKIGESNDAFESNKHV